MSQGEMKKLEVDGVGGGVGDGSFARLRNVTLLQRVRLPVGNVLEHIYSLSNYFTV